MRPLQKGRPGIRARDLIFYEHAMSRGRRLFSGLLDLVQRDQTDIPIDRKAIQEATRIHHEFYEFSWQCMVGFENGITVSIITSLNLFQGHASFGECRSLSYEVYANNDPRTDDYPRRLDLSELDQFLDDTSSVRMIVDRSDGEIDKPDASSETTLSLPPLTIDTIPEEHRKLVGSFLFTDDCWQKDLRFVAVEIEVYQSFQAELLSARRTSENQLLNAPILALNEWCRRHCASGYAWCGFHPTWAFESADDAAHFSAHLETISNQLKNIPGTTA